MIYGTSQLFLKLLNKDMEELVRELSFQLLEKSIEELAYRVF